MCLQHGNMTIFSYLTIVLNEMLVHVYKVFACLRGTLSVDTSCSYIFYCMIFLS